MGKKAIIKTKPLSEEVIELMATFKTEKGRDTVLTPAEVQEFYDTPDMDASTDAMEEYEKKLNKHPGSDDDADDVDDENTEQDDGGKEGHMVPDISASHNREAKELWYELKQNTDFVESLVEAVAVDRKRKRSSATVAFNLSKTKDIVLTLKAKPFPGTRFDDTEIIKLKGANPGRNIKVDVEKAGEESFWNKVYGESSEGMDLRKRIAALKTLKADQLANTDYLEYARKSKEWIEAELKQEQQAFNVGAGHLKDAVKTILRMDIMETTLVHARFRIEEQDGVTSLQRRTAAIEVHTIVPIDPKKPDTMDNKLSVSKYFSVSTFLKVTSPPIWNTVLAGKTANDQYTAMTIPRKPRIGKAEKEAAKQVPVFMDNVVSVESGMITFAMSLNKDASLETKMRERLNGAGSDGLLKAIWRVSNFCDAITALPTYQQRMAALMEQSPSKKDAA